MEALKVAQPVFVLRYDKKDITADLTPFQIGLSYSDNLDGNEADSLELTLEDSDGRWLNGWYPVKGDQLDLQIGYRGKPLVPCGAFEIDELEVSGPPSEVRIKALAAGITKDLRTRKGHAYENTTLAGIVATVARRHGLRVVGDIQSIPVRRVTQMHEEDLKFLRRLAAEYGYAFNVRGTTLTFAPLDALRAANTVLVLRPSDLTAYRFRDKVKDTPKSARVAHHDSKTKKLISYDVDSDGKVVAKPSADTLKLNTRAESPAQAQAKARAALNRANDEATTCGVTLWGTPQIVAGVNVLLEGFGQLSGRYQVAGSRHTLQRSTGYVTEAELRRVELGSAAQATSSTAKTGKLKVASLQDGKVVLK